MSPQLSLRRQQVSEKLNEWAVFNEKNKELCEWLTQMESKVSQNGDISIDEMIEKLRKVISKQSNALVKKLLKSMPYRSIEYRQMKELSLACFEV